LRTPGKIGLSITGGSKPSGTSAWAQYKWTVEVDVGPAPFTALLLAAGLAAPAAAADDLLLAMIQVAGTVGDAATAGDGGVGFRGVADLHFYADGCRPPECESTVVEDDAGGSCAGVRTSHPNRWITTPSPSAPGTSRFS
jgi:hypothetical protein